MNTRYALPLILALVVSACGKIDPAMQEQTRQTQLMAAEAMAQAGMPKIVNFTELKLNNWLFELRDQEGLQTYSYVQDMEGRLWHFCNSIGYGMPFSAQRSNPEAPVVLNPTGKTGGRATFVLPQPEPNGLYPPTSSSATWVICAASDGTPMPIYTEPTLIVSPFPLRAVGSYTLEEPPNWR
jgi:hypothetical protein